MRLLLDTRIWIWSLLEPERLSPRVAATLVAPDSEPWPSSISLWELTVLVERGRRELDREIGDWIDEALRAAPLREAPVTHAVVRALAGVETPHRDPADRFLAATAATLDLDLVTADARLLDGRGYRVLAND